MASLPITKRALRVFLAGALGLTVVTGEQIPQTQPAGTEWHPGR